VLTFGAVLLMTDEPVVNPLVRGKFSRNRQTARFVQTVGIAILVLSSGIAYAGLPAPVGVQTHPVPSSIENRAEQAPGLAASIPTKSGGLAESHSELSPAGQGAQPLGPESRWPSTSPSKEVHLGTSTEGAARVRTVPPIESAGSSRSSNAEALSGVPIRLAESRPTRIPDTLSKFGVSDFSRLFKGRERTTQLEQHLIRDALTGFDTSRIFELGIGLGRLTPTFRAPTREFVGVDVSLELLEHFRDRLASGDRPLLVHANVLHLPFVSSCASGASLVRVYNHLDRPAAAFNEMRRLLVPGGKFIVSASLRPSLATIELDLKSGLARRSGVAFHGVTFGKEAIVTYRFGQMVLFYPTEAQFESTVASTGATILAEYGAGITDLYLLRAMPIPPTFLVKAGQLRPRSRLFPMRWLVGQWGRPDRNSIPPIADILACPRCRTPLGHVDLARDWAIDCTKCQFPLRFEGSILRANWGGDEST
jgi:SAM-dependent methyltransferase